MQIRVKLTKEIINVIPRNSNEWIDTSTKKVYKWDELEPIRVKASSEKAQIHTMGIKVKMGVNGEIGSIKEKM